MIFVTVGTHEQPFNRLVEYMDKWASENNEEVIIQTGFSTYKPQNCEWKKLYPYTSMIDMVKKARIVITHGGPSSFIMPLQIGKIPIVVPRKHEFGEHINNHQVIFCNQVNRQQGNIIIVDNICDIGSIIARYDEIVWSMKVVLNDNNSTFCTKFCEIVEKMVNQ